MESDGEYCRPQKEKQNGVIRSYFEVADAAANGTYNMLEFLLENGADPNGHGRDGTTPLCAAALWGNEQIVQCLLSNGANQNATNQGTAWTALHAAAFQEHGKIVHILLEYGADPYLQDAEGRTPVDYASVSEAIWPFFAAEGCTKSTKKELLEKGILRRMECNGLDESNASNNISYYSRPGSSYGRAQLYPPNSFNRNNNKSRDTKTASFVKSRGPIDPLSNSPYNLSNQ